MHPPSPSLHVHTSCPHLVRGWAHRDTQAPPLQPPASSPHGSPGMLWCSGSRRDRAHGCPGSPPPLPPHLLHLQDGRDAQAGLPLCAPRRTGGDIQGASVPPCRPHAGAQGRLPCHFAGDRAPAEAAPLGPHWERAIPQAVAAHRPLIGGGPDGPSPQGPFRRAQARTPSSSSSSRLTWPSRVTLPSGVTLPARVAAALGAGELRQRRLRELAVAQPVLQDVFHHLPGDHHLYREGGAGCLASPAGCLPSSPAGPPPAQEGGGGGVTHHLLRDHFLHGEGGAGRGHPSSPWGEPPSARGGGGRGHPSPPSGDHHLHRGDNSTTAQGEGSVTLWMSRSTPHTTSHLAPLCGGVAESRRTVDQRSKVIGAPSGAVRGDLRGRASRGRGGWMVSQWCRAG